MTNKLFIEEFCYKRGMQNKTMAGCRLKERLLFFSVKR